MNTRVHVLAGIAAAALRSSVVSATERTGPLPWCVAAFFAALPDIAEWLLRNARRPDATLTPDPLLADDRISETTVRGVADAAKHARDSGRAVRLRIRPLPAARGRLRLSILPRRVEACVLTEYSPLPLRGIPPLGGGQDKRKLRGIPPPREEPDKKKLHGIPTRSRFNLGQAPLREGGGGTAAGGSIPCTPQRREHGLAFCTPPLFRNPVARRSRHRSARRRHPIIRARLRQKPRYRHRRSRAQPRTRSPPLAVLAARPPRPAPPRPRLPPSLRSRSRTPLTRAP